MKKQKISAENAENRLQIKKRLIFLAISDQKFSFKSSKHLSEWVCG